MGRAPCCDKANVKKGPWSPEEDAKLKDYIDKFGTGGNWIALPQKIGLRRCGKSCRLRWLNYLRPNIKHGGFSEEEDNIICNLYISIGSRWSIIAAQLPGRTDNDIKNYWNTRLKKKLLGRRKQSNLNRLRGGGASCAEDPRETLSNSAIERLQLHMQLQSNESCPLSLWPQLSPLQEKMIQQSLQLFNGSSNPLLPINNASSLSPTDDSQKLDQLYQAPNLMSANNNPPNPMLQEEYLVNMSNEGMENSTVNMPGSVDGMLDRGCDKLPGVDQYRQVSTFQAELDDLLGYKGSGFFPLEGQVSEFDCFKEVDGSRDMTAWWSHNFDTSSLSSTSWDSGNSVLHRHHESGVSCQEMV